MREPFPEMPFMLLAAARAGNRILWLGPAAAVRVPPVLPALVVLLHVFSVFALVAGIVGRGVCHARAKRAADLATLRTAMEIGSVFELTLIRPVSFVVLLTGSSRRGRGAGRSRGSPGAPRSTGSWRPLASSCRTAP